MWLKLRQLKGKLSLAAREVWRQFRFDTSEFLFKLLLIVIIISLGVNLYNSYRKGIDNKQIIIREQEKLAQLRDQRDELTDQVKYFSSIEYQKGYARDSQGLAEDGEMIFQILRPKNEEVEYFNVTDDPIRLDKTEKWWGKLFVGI